MLHRFKVSAYFLTVRGLFHSGYYLTALRRIKILFASLMDITIESDESGYRETFSTLSGGEIGHTQQIELETLGLCFQSYVYFAESYAVNQNPLGRQVCVQLITLGLNDFESTIYLMRFDRRVKRLLSGI